jgi:uncharacterized protein YebE (UPF0316 family)
LNSVFFDRDDLRYAILNLKAPAKLLQDFDLGYITNTDRLFENTRFFKEEFSLVLPNVESAERMFYGAEFYAGIVHLEMPKVRNIRNIMTFSKTVMVNLTLPEEINLKGIGSFTTAIFKVNGKRIKADITTSQDEHNISPDITLAEWES